MLEIGKVQRLRAVKEVDFGFYFADLEDTKGENRVLLPIKKAPKDCQIGTETDLFLYKDSSDRLIASTTVPMITLGQIGRLKVASVTKIGAFLEWGLEKDLFLPFKEQTFRVKEGDYCLVALYTDKSERLCATMKVYPYLQKNGTYEKDQWIDGTLYEISENFGGFVAVDDLYSGLIAKKELVKDIRPGTRIHARVIDIREDGKIDLSLREKAYIQMSVDAQKVMNVITSYDGVLPFNDKAAPETIRRELDMSKNEFKRAVGNLLKAGKIEITEKFIRLK